MSLTGNKDTDTLVLMELNDYELGKVCQVNKYVKKLCDSESFWYNRLMMKLSELQKELQKAEYDESLSDVMKKIKDALEFTTWKEFYIFLFSKRSKRKSNFNIRESIVKFINKENLFVVLKGLEVQNLEGVDIPEWIDINLFLKILKRKWFVETGISLEPSYVYQNVKYEFKTSLENFIYEIIN